MIVEDEVEVLDEKIRDLCRKISQETDPAVARKQCAALQRLLKVQHDTTKLRLQKIAVRFGNQMRSTHTTPPPKGESASRMRSLLAFLGLVPPSPVHN